MLLSCRGGEGVHQVVYSIHHLSVTPSPVTHHRPHCSNWQTTINDERVVRAFNNHRSSQEMQSDPTDKGPAHWGEYYATVIV